MSAIIQPRLRIVPVTLREANALVDRLHRHHPPSRGHKLSLGVVDEAEVLRGVAIISYPRARMITRAVAEVVRVATDGTPNACSALYGAACRVCHEQGFITTMTYTLAEEPGTSLRAAGWRPVAVTSGGSWDRDSRPRVDSAPTGRKVRWECRHSHARSIDLAKEGR